MHPHLKKKKKKKKRKEKKSQNFMNWLNCINFIDIPKYVKNIKMKLLDLNLESFSVKKQHRRSKSIGFE